jgi:hypothetical protein|tara:strand:+ start:452 stop:766 length:315 start_codon:yes stop_codon:yes gene_type:complete
MDKRWMTLGVCLLLLAGGCTNRGDDIADRINQNVINKIQSGEIRTQEQLETALGPLMESSMIELGIDPEAPSTVAETEAFKAAMEKYREEWIALLPDNGGSPTQ